MNSRLKPIPRANRSENVDFKGLQKGSNGNAFFQKPIQSESMNALIESIDYYV